ARSPMSRAMRPSPRVLATTRSTIPAGYVSRITEAISSATSSGAAASGATVGPPVVVSSMGGTVPEGAAAPLTGPATRRSAPRPQGSAEPFWLARAGGRARSVGMEQPTLFADLTDPAPPPSAAPAAPPAGEPGPGPAS